jgi:serine/threonine-protein kinase
MSDVFISYKAEDRRRVQPLVQALQADGYSVWWDEHIGTGDEWRQTIEKHLDSAKCVVVIWTKRSVGPDGHFVRDEASRAQRRHVYVPVILDSVSPPLGFGESQAASLKGWKGDRSDSRYQAVLAAVKRIAGSGTGTAAAAPAHAAPVSRRAVLAGSGVAVVAVAGVGAWEWLRPSAASAAGSVAVLPFQNLSGDPSQAYFSDGIAEEIRSALTRINGLKVAGSTSSEAVRNDDAQTAAKKLDVASILTGSVRQSPSTIRISTELIDGRTGLDKWSQNYDRSPGDAIKIQTDIAENVAAALSAALGGAARAAVSVGGTNNPEAQKLLLQALQAPSVGTKDANIHAQGLLDSAIALDSTYADAFALKATFLEFYADAYANGLAELRDYRSKARQNAQVAMQLAPDLPGAHRAMAEIQQGDLEIASADAQYRRALQLAPGDARTLRDYSNFLGRLGHPSEALQLADKAVALDPLAILSYRSRFFALYSGRRYVEAVAFSKQLQRQSPQLFNWAAEVGWALFFLGRLDEARSYLNLAPADSYRRAVGEAALLIREGKKAEVPARLSVLQQNYGENASYQYAEVYAQLGDVDRAFEALARAWQIRDNGLLSTTTDPFLDPIRPDPRYRALLKTMNFPA